MIKKLSSFSKYQVVVLAVAHPEYLNLDFKKLIGKNKLIFLDANNILTKRNRNLIKLLKSEILSIGR